MDYDEFRADDIQRFAADLHEDLRWARTGGVSEFTSSVSIRREI